MVADLWWWAVGVFKQQKTPHCNGVFEVWSGKRGSNPQPSVWETDALPIAPFPRIKLPEYTQKPDSCQLG